MSITRKCESCNQMIPQECYVELTVRILRTNEGDNQTTMEQTYGDYCDGCVANGSALEDLVAELVIYKGLESEKKKL